MQNDNVTVLYKGERIEIKKGTTLKFFADSRRMEADPPPLACMVDNDLTELNHRIEGDCSIEILDARDPNGFRVFTRGAVFLMLYAAKEVLGRQTRVVISHSIKKNLYCEFSEPSIEVTPELLSRILEVMRKTIERKAAFEKLYVSIEDGLKLAQSCGLRDKELVLKYRRTANVSFYKLDWFYNYFYGAMPIDAGVLSGLGLIPEGKGFMFLFPNTKQLGDPNAFNVSAYKRPHKIANVFEEASRWAHILETDTVAALNDKICYGNRGDIIRVCEALHEKKLAYIADRVKDRGTKVVLIAGPSSSGKTTFAERLCVQLRVNGLAPHVVSLDNYYVNREATPLDEDGKPDFEALEAIDIAQFNKDLLTLLNGGDTPLPIYNFVSGAREYRGRHIKLKPNDVLVIEGIHGLNPALTHDLADKDIFKVFISALTQLNIDDHNRIPTTDTRLIRRMVRDNQFRGFDALRTIQMWPSVTRGAEKHIFPYQEEADEIFNSALVYELSVLKQFAEPLLFGVEKNRPERAEARRLLKFLDCFIGLPTDEVPINSILREFIGGSCFRT